MKLSLSQCGTLELLQNSIPPENKEGNTILSVLYCGVCRTDAKMWHQGHRDLVLPRVLGHEIAGIDKTTGQLFTVWPGQACGHCRYCMDGRENLCEEMRITGFHSDGGFARYVSVPQASLIPVEVSVEPHIITFAEPVACVLNGVERLGPVLNGKVIIYGGGLVGVLTALVFCERNYQVTLIEQSLEKINRLQSLCDANSIELCKDTVKADFDIAMNCCDSHIAFSLCITKLRKGGRLIFFSGLQKNTAIDTNLLNLIHYKELEVSGSYGPGREHMVQAILFCARQQNNLLQLIEKIIGLEEVESVLPHLLSGDALKYIVKMPILGQPPSTNFP